MEMCGCRITHPVSSSKLFLFTGKVSGIGSVLSVKQDGGRFTDIYRLGQFDCENGAGQSVCLVYIHITSRFVLMETTNKRQAHRLRRCPVIDAGVAG